MASSIKIITAEIVKIEEKVAELDRKLENVYSQYLGLLIQSVQKQLIVASYQICTQIYPESFLRLSFNQRHELQNNIREVGQQLQTRFMAYLDLEESNYDPKVTSLPPQSDSEKTASSEEKSPMKPEVILNNPEELVQRYQELEKAIHHALESISRQANRYLQEAEILPNSLPAKVLEMAMQTEDNRPGTSEIPNVLNLLIETEQEEKKESSLTKITAIHIRLQEIEFAEPKLSNSRNQIRHLWEQLKQIRQQYRRKRRELSIVEAEAAWRASWYED